MSTNSEPASTGNLPAFSISLSQHPYTDHPFSRRYIVLDKQNPTLKIGRSSKLAAKGFVPSSQNGWYDSPVMSRQHAEIIADFTQKRLKLRDLGSLHGTYINESDQRLEKDEQVEIKDGDNIRFGVDVMRKKTFPPTIVKVGLEYIEVPKAKLEQDTTRPRASSTFKVPDISDSDMEYQDEDSNVSPLVQGTQSAARGLAGRSWKGEVIDLTHPVGSGNVITDPQKQVIDVDQDDNYKNNWGQSDKINDSHQNQDSHSKSDIASIPSPKSPIDSNDSSCSNYGSSGEDCWPQNVGALQPTASQAPNASLHVSLSQHPVPSQYYAALDDDDDWDSEMSSDYEPEYEPESANSEVSGGDLNGDGDSSERGFEYDYPYSESDSDFSAGQDSDAESEAEGDYGREPSSNWAMPDFSNVVTGPSSIIDKGHSTARLVTPDIKDDVIDRAIPQVNYATPADMRPASYPVDSPLFLSFTHPRDVQLATPKSNKSAGDIDETSPINKPLNGPLVEMEEAPWYPSDKAKFFEARKENRMTIMQSSPVTREYSRLAISDIMDENAPVGKGKRKAEAISSSTEEDLAWQASEVQKPEASGENEREEVQEVMEVDKDMEVGDLIEPSTEAATDITMTVESLDLPVSVVTSTVRLDDDDGDRPTKRQRLRNIAERVGYVALGGVATGAMMFGALVYTAPTFV
ncbi:uncharacterized protein B0T23DRAFT_435604 [Neurospora hispaniola]|uniref:FHA domain-containing protein n=1 Tax=Neurospora hispaniola TaxID=588809 RepID=A0AAJ0MWB4_9PEZI|nr:hypothetical protein B0T23DRAFT_435604 [Neurospora hispaniola]